MRGVIVIAAALMTSCDRGAATGEPSGPIPGYSHAIATRVCGERDGPALGVYMTPTESADDPPPRPYLMILVNEAPEVVVGRSWSWNGANETAGAGECARVGPCAGFPLGRILVGAFGADSAIDVRVDLGRESGERVRGVVSARWVSRPLGPCP